MPGWWDAFQQLLTQMGQSVVGKTPLGPANPAGGVPPGSSLPRTGGFLQNPGAQGGLMQAIAAPLEIFAAVEAARGKPVGSAYLGGIGDLLGTYGAQRSKTAGEQASFKQQLRLAQERGIIPQGQGIEETLTGMAEGGDPESADKYLDSLTKFWEEKQKTRPVPFEYDAFAQSVGYPNFAAVPNDKKAGVLAAMGAWKRKQTGAEATPDWMKHPIGEKLYAMGVKDPDKATPQQVAAANELDRKEKLGDKKAVIDYAASKGIVATYNPDTDSFTYTPKTEAAGKPAKPGKGPTIKGGWEYTPMPDLGPGINMVKPIPATTPTGRAAEFLGVGPSGYIDWHGSKKIYPRKVTRPDGKTVDVYDLPDGRSVIE